MRTQALWLAALFSMVFVVPAQSETTEPLIAEELAEMLSRAEKYTAPGDRHKLLAGFVGKWSTKTWITLGGTKSEPETGTADFRWLVENRWLASETRGTFLGAAFEAHSVLGYDNFKMSYVTSSVTNMDTAMHYAEGDMDDSGETLLLFGTLNEYLTGEHDKMTQTVWRFPDPDRMIVEVHDLSMGETHTKVVEVHYTRQ